MVTEAKVWPLERRRPRVTGADVVVVVVVVVATVEDMVDIKSSTVCWRREYDVGKGNASFRPRIRAHGKGLAGGGSRRGTNQERRLLANGMGKGWF